MTAAEDEPAAVYGTQGVVRPSQHDEPRVAGRRAQYLAASTDLTRREAEAVAWSELGYSVSGIATKMGSTDGTIKGYFRRTVAQYGHGAVETKTARRRGDLTNVSLDTVCEYEYQVRDYYFEAADKNPDVVPEPVADAFGPTYTGTDGDDGGEAEGDE